MTSFSSFTIFAATLDPHPAMVAPFALLLLAIACCPLLSPKFWEHYYRHVAIGLGVVTLGYYLGVLHAGSRVFTALHEYASFILFVGALFVIAGGIHITVKGEATPSRNVLFLFTGAVLANLVGTTGASMLLVRPWIRVNKYRYTGFHTAFFIFLVSNVGGCLTPIGDPPLFLGYLKGIPFFWITARCWKPWSIAVSALLVIFYFIDRWNFARAPREIRETQTSHETFNVTGLLNVAFLALVLTSVIIVPPGWRELLMLAATVGSLRLTPRHVHDANHFTLGPIKEVAWIFAGIFATMLPALDYLELHASALGIREPAQFYWLSGSLSGVLDNAPTYLTFLAAAFGLHGQQIDDPTSVARFLSDHEIYVIAVSLGSVFFGAMTYIGNGPNFMVKAICDHAKVHTPSFFSYIIRYSAPLLLPVLALVAWIFFRH